MKSFAKHLDHAGIAEAIRGVEGATSGLVRVSISPLKTITPVIAAEVEFALLGLDKSPEQNNVLIFVAPRARKFAVIGGPAVHAKCGDAFWQALAEAMSGYFRNGEFTHGIIHGIQTAGKLLTDHFPRNDAQK